MDYMEIVLDIPFQHADLLRAFTMKQNLLERLRSMPTMLTTTNIYFDRWQTANSDTPN